MNQQILLINSLFGKSQLEPIDIGITTKYGVKMTMEVYPNGDVSNVLPYRMKFEDGTSTLWNSFSNLEEIENYFRMCSFV